ncbi:MAG: hypothetical protein EZS28_025766 [Streblomastix strix]|uniref:Uncharacterized protein n=1 Tax=Streblomastix strix TaxID=222440 RepID=A0A5J4V898_9EUKA|nr:MAG: hypothetical protein EZS28_025766 [Streblomastix strix]
MILIDTLYYFNEGIAAPASGYLKTKSIIENIATIISLVSLLVLSYMLPIVVRRYYLYLQMLYLDLISNGVILSELASTGSTYLIQMSTQISQ